MQTIRHYLAAGALVLASMLVFSTTVSADDFSAGSLFEPIEMMDLATCPNLVTCAIEVAPAEKVASLPTGQNDCPTSTAYPTRLTDDGLMREACTSRRYDPGWRYI